MPLQDQHISMFVGGRLVSNLRFADDIDFMANTSSELKYLTNRVYKSRSVRDEG
ncbi:hypothetical protein DPMN_100659 [Dreissena polymorpha]|uniref:Uncharacterized protein n=1 Tax=Dreissena polymorpha TaxID=45954 RepID=A0A9D4LHB0_DREPO|nr:hypothetical protein DPMN_100659 [Dreissena polymorpha]